MLDMESNIMNSILRVARKFRLHSQLCQLDEVDLTFLQLHTLLHLQLNPGLSTSQFAKDLLTKLPTTMRLLDQLGKLGFVEKRADEKDKRISRYFLTVQGESILQKCKQKRTAHILEVLSILTDTEKAQLSHIMEKIAQNVESK